MRCEVVKNDENNLFFVCFILVLSQMIYTCTVEPLLYDHPQNHIGAVV